MYLLITYDVATSSEGGSRRLRRIAKICEDYGQRVQYSVFECKVDPAQFAQMRAKLFDELDLDQDSVRFYFLGDQWKKKVEHHGVKEGYDVDGFLVV
ncbi:MAG: CRISPR-associated endonuclease Cas2 [Verrucomicrobiota bacterium]